MLDSDDYPTEEAIAALQRHRVVGGDRMPHDVPLDEFLSLLESMWWAADWGFERTKTRLHLSTGGWSGNEEVIGELRQTWFWHLCWILHRRGGHYRFDLTRWPKTNKAATCRGRATGDG